MERTNGLTNAKGMWDESILREDIRQQKGASNLAFNEKVKELQKSGRHISHFAFGQSPFPVPQCAVEALQKNAAVHDYLPVAGIAELRAGICAMHKRQDGVELDPDYVLVGPGSKELIYLTMAVFNGEVLLVAPAWTTYGPQSVLAGHDAVVIRTRADDRYKLTADQLEQQLVTRQLKPNRLLVLNNPGNPTGVVYTSGELLALAEVCRRHRVAVLSDEIYARLVFKGQHVSMAQVYPEGTILVSGFSKWLSAGGWRLGYAHFPRQLQPLFSAVHSASSNTFSCASAPVQYALAEVLRPEHAEGLDRYVSACSKVLSAAGSFCARELGAVGVKASPSEAAYYFMPDFEVCRAGLAARGITTGAQMVEAMLEDIGVALMASSCFLMKDTDLVTRFCFVCFDGAAALEQVQAGADVDDQFLARQCPDVVAGVRRLQNWVRKHTLKAGVAGTPDH